MNRPRTTFCVLQRLLEKWFIERVAAYDSVKGDDRRRWELTCQNQEITTNELR